MRSINGAWDAQEKELEGRILDGLLFDEERKERNLRSCSFDIYSCTTPKCRSYREEVTGLNSNGPVDEGRLRQLVRFQQTAGIRRTVNTFQPYSECPKCERMTLKTTTPEYEKPTRESHVFLGGASHAMVIGSAVHASGQVR